MLRRAVKPPPTPKFREPEVSDKYMCPQCLLRYASSATPKVCPDCGAPADAAHKQNGETNPGARA